MRSTTAVKHKREKGDLNGAIKDFDEVIRLRLNDVEAYNARGIAKGNKGDLDGAIKDYDEAIRLHPNHSGMHLTRGRAKVLIGDKEGGRVDIARGADLDPTSAAAAIWLVGLGGEKDRLEKFAAGTAWISSVARYYLGQMTREQLLSEAKNGTGDREVRDRLCETHGYIGLLAEKNGDAKLASASYEACVANGAAKHFMCVWAKARLAAMPKPTGGK
jgi:lipoprotein NlpI